MTVPRSPRVQRIRLSSGEIRLTWPGTLTELKGADISADQATICLGPEDAPGLNPVTPDVITPSIITVADYIKSGGTNPFGLALNATLHQLNIQMMIGIGYAVPTVGSYFVWGRLPDQSEIEWFQFHKVIVT